MAEKCDYHEYDYNDLRPSSLFYHCIPISEAAIITSVRHSSAYVCKYKRREWLDLLFVRTANMAMEQAHCV